MLFQHLEMLIQLLSTFTNVVYKLKTTYQHVGNICWGFEATFHINIWWKAKPHFWTALHMRYDTATTSGSVVPAMAPRKMPSGVGRPGLGP